MPICWLIDYWIFCQWKILYFSMIRYEYSNSNLNFLPQFWGVFFMYFWNIIKLTKCIYRNDYGSRFLVWSKGGHCTQHEILLDNGCFSKRQTKGMALAGYISVMCICCKKKLPIQCFKYKHFFERYQKDFLKIGANLSFSNFKMVQIGFAKSRFFQNPGIGIIPISKSQSRDWFFGTEQ